MLKDIPSSGCLIHRTEFTRSLCPCNADVIDEGPYIYPDYHHDLKYIKTNQLQNHPQLSTQISRGSR